MWLGVGQLRDSDAPGLPSELLLASNLLWEMGASKVMGHVEILLFGSLLITGSLLPAQSTATNPQTETANTPSAQTEKHNGTSVPSSSPGNAASDLKANDTPRGGTTNAAQEGQVSAEPQTPKTEILDTSATAGALATDGHDPILDPPAFPQGMTTLVGGVIAGVDRISNRLKIKVFGGGQWTIFFDERTHIFRNGAEVTQLALKPGDRVYVDTMLDNNQRDVFARNIRVGGTAQPADTEGQIVEVDTQRHEVTLRDNINSVAERFSVADDTKISQGSGAASFADLRPGSLVRVKFAPERPNRGQAREIVIVARPGASFRFVGPVTFLDRHRGVLAVHNRLDDKTYDLHIAANRMDATANLAVGSEVQVVATFDATQYTARQVTVTKAAGKTAK